jgi:mycofactocin system glycosyltransferase
VISYRLDASWRRPGDGLTVVAGSPLRLFRLSEGGAHVMGRVEAGDPPDTESVRQLLDRFVEAGALHPQYDASPFTAADVTVVIPSLQHTPSVPADLRVIVVDDGSTPALSLPPNDPHAQLLRLEHNQGPAAARNAGLAHVTTPLVAFVDADVHLADGWLEPLLAAFADPKVALVAPRVAGAPGPTWLDRYEMRHSPLDLGTQPARVAPGTRVSYVPAAVLLCRVDVVRELGGFDDTMRVGEDVDLVWRLVEGGHRCRYESESVVHHRARSTLTALLRQRFGYGRSAAALAIRHEGALAPARMSGWSLGVWALVAARRPALAIGVAAGTAVALQRRLRQLPPGEIARLVGIGHLAAGRQLAEATRRVWWPLAVPAMLCRRARWWVLSAFVAPALVDAIRTRRAAPLLDLPAHTADAAAYGAGVWWGVATERTMAPLLPAISSWPTRGVR